MCLIVYGYIELAVVIRYIYNWKILHFGLRVQTDPKAFSSFKLFSFTLSEEHAVLNLTTKQHTMLQRVEQPDAD